LEAYGGASGVRDQNALQSAVASPAQTFDGNFLYESLAAMASAYWFGISENQAFVDGNKRTAIIACEVFLNYNGLELTFDDDSEACSMALRIAHQRRSGAVDR
jgi:death on curing protein